MEDRFKVVYTGELQPYVSAREAVHNIAVLFKTNENSVRTLVLGGRPREIKLDLDKATADRYLSALSKAGLVVHIEPMVPPPSNLRITPLSIDGGSSPTPTPTPERDAGTPCPKCGASAVRDGICGACGIVVAKYVARIAAEAAPEQGAPHLDRPAAPTNPYAPPQADLSPDTTPGEEEALTGPHALSAGRGWAWISRGFWHFKGSPGTWILILIAYMFITIAISFIPFIGSLALYVLMPIFLGGMMLGAHSQARGEPLGFQDLFAGFSHQTGQLAASGILYLVGIILAAIPAVLIVGLPLVGMMAGMDPSALEQDPQLVTQSMDGLMQGSTLLLAFLVLLLFMLPVVMAYWFAPTLIAIEGLNAWPAMKLSFRGCLKNILPFLVYGIAGLALIVVGTLPILLGLLVVLPTLTASMYTAYRDIYYGHF